MPLRLGFITLCVLLATPVIANDADDTVDIPSLKVKERLHSIERVNVTAETPKQDIQPESQAVSDILAEADELDRAAINTQPAAH